MDEIVFRSSQKLDNFQIQASIVANKAKDVFVLYVEKGRAVLLQLWHNDAFEEIKHKLSESILKIISTAKEIKSHILYYADPQEMYLALLSVFGKEWTRRDLFFACAGLLIGGSLGLMIGLSYRRTEPFVRYMQAIQCTNYLGTQQSKSDLPVTLGRDCTGIITDVGSKVQRLEVGDEVWVTVPFWSQGTMCQTVLVPEKWVGRKPKNIGFESACSLPYSGSLALSALGEAGIGPSNARKKRILIQGGCSPVGCVLVQLLNHWKAEVTTTCYKRAIPVVKALGAADIIVLEESEAINDTFVEDDGPQMSIPSLIKQLEVKNELYDVIIKTNDECDLENKHFSKFLKTDGTIISTLPPALSSDSCGAGSGFILSWYIKLKYKLLSMLGLPFNYFDETHLCYVTLDKLSEYVEDGYLQTVVDKVYQPHDIEMAIGHMQSSRSIGSTIITFR
ncbi:unnamed protein product [Callosobruchus maculatus]|uniref:Enoyl reductase (ER) domain-containing protein n=1 Tax=Callosobruchus maculatus TaxID=64391 RepID=A0A653D182_CALMS|nr:unnamed protein product [Callosobruchus maculatus]